VGEEDMQGGEKGTGKRKGAKGQEGKWKVNENGKGRGRQLRRGRGRGTETGTGKGKVLLNKP